MAALIRHGSLANSLKSTSALLGVRTAAAPRDQARTKTKIVPQQYPNLDATRQSLNARGFLRPVRPYEPPANVDSVIADVCQRHNVSVEDNTRLDDAETRCRILIECSEQLAHTVPNSVLHTIETIGQLREFYQTPCSTSSPYAALQTQDLPKNLHVQYDYVRFHPDTDEMFNGKTAFPKSSTLVTGLKYRRKYKGHKQEDFFLKAMLRNPDSNTDI